MLKFYGLEIYNHQNNRNYATSYQLDLFQIKFNEKTYNQDFRINYQTSFGI